MTREEAIEVIKRTKGAIVYTEKEKEALETLIPEFAESEDERIRKALIEVFKKKLERGFEWVEYGIPNRSVLDWLEKQKENPKSVDSIPSDCTSDAKCEDRDSEYVVFPEDALVVARACEKLEAHGYPELADALINVNLYMKEQKPAEYIKRNSKEWYSLLAEQYDKGFWKGKAEQKPEWKPSEEQLKYLLMLADYFESEGGTSNAKTLRDFYEQLKKL